MVDNAANLLICDGLDEHVLGSNKDVVKIIRHEKYLNCHIVLTSRPHSTREIQDYFQTVVNVEGFTRSEAKKFALCVVLDEEKVEQILDFNPTGEKEEVVLHKCPILLSFICILVREKAIDLFNTTMPTGEIYTRMIQCLYKKFIIRRKRQYVDDEFMKVVSVVGRIAWDTLLSDYPFFERSRVEREVGNDVFDYGFLIGNEDLIGNVKADILITFAHRSIQEFFGAFFFVLQLIEEKDVDTLLGASRKDPIFMKNPLFLHFIFWLLSEKCKTDYFCLGDINKACEILDSYIYSKIHRLLGSSLLTRQFPAIDFQRALDSKESINFEHFGRMLTRFKNIKYFANESDASKDWILNRIFTTCHILNVMVEDELLHFVDPRLLKSGRNCTNVLLSNEAYKKGVLQQLCERVLQFNIKLVVYLFVRNLQSMDLSYVLHQGMEKLHIIGTALPGTEVTFTGLLISEVTFTGLLISCPFLTHLSIIGNLRTSQHVMLAISKAVRKGKLPGLQNLSFVNIEGQLEKLFNRKAILTNLTHLNLCNCDLDKKDLEALCFAWNNGLLPNLMSLGLSDRNKSLGARSFRLKENSIFSQNWGALTSFSVKPLTTLGLKDLVKGIGQRKLTNLKKLCLLMMQNETCNLREMQSKKLPNLEHLFLQRCITSKKNLKHASRMLNHWTLHTLDISHSRGIRGELSTLTSQDLTSLRTLILHDCQLNEQDMMSLAEANDKGRLSKLENLDLSENLPLIVRFITIGSKWLNLRKLKINQRDELYSSTKVDDLSGLLPVIKELRITGGDSFHIRGGCWGHLERLDIVVSHRQSLISVISHVDDGVLPALQTVCFFSSSVRLSIPDDIHAKLNRIDICVAHYNLEKIMINTGLTEQL